MFQKRLPQALYLYLSLVLKNSLLISVRNGTDYLSSKGGFKTCGLARRACSNPARCQLNMALLCVRRSVMAFGDLAPQWVRGLCQIVYWAIPETFCHLIAPENRPKRAARMRFHLPQLNLVCCLLYEGLRWGWLHWACRTVRVAVWAYWLTWIHVCSRIWVAACNLLEQSTCSKVWQWELQPSPTCLTRGHRYPQKGSLCPVAYSRVHALCIQSPG